MPQPKGVVKADAELCWLVLRCKCAEDYADTFVEF